MQDVCVDLARDELDLYSVVAVVSSCICVSVRACCENVSRTDGSVSLNGRSSSKASNNNGHAPHGAVVFITYHASVLRYPILDFYLTLAR